jgi:FtsH-binding integral membrane protein
MSEKSVSSSTEENVVKKVAELMETLDEIKKYNVLDKHLKKFTIIVVSSIAICIGVNLSISFFGLLSAYNEFERFFLNFPIVLIPTVGVLVGILFVRRKMNEVKTGEWKKELSKGFPSALKLLSEIDWDTSFDVVSSGRLGYALYSLVKGAAYGFIFFFIIGFLINLTTYILLHRTGALGYASFHFSFLAIIIYLKHDLSKRFNEIREIDKLQLELRRLSLELRNAEL